MLVPVTIAWVPFAISTFIGFVVGSLWYGALFGEVWKRSLGRTKEQQAECERQMTKEVILMIMAHALLSIAVRLYVAIHVLTFVSDGKPFTVPDAIRGMGWNWLGFVALPSMNHAMFEGNKMILWVINSGYDLVNTLLTVCAYVVLAF